MDRKCLNCAFSSPVLDVDQELTCSVDDTLVDLDFSCDLFTLEHEFDEEESWLEE